MKNTRSIIIGSLLIIILAMAVGYSAFATQLTINGTAEIIGEWNIRIINIDIQDISEGCNAGRPEYTNTKATFDAKLVKPGDSITYLITIENAGTIDAVLEGIVFKEEDGGSDDIKYTTTEIAHVLEAGKQTTLTVKIQYNPKTSVNPSIKNKTITGIIQYTQK